MKKFLIFAMAGWILCGSTATLRANALAATMAEERAPEHLPKVAIAKLEVTPARVDLHGKYGYTQVLITARLADGSAADVTRLSKLTVADNLATVTPLGQMVPLKEGEGTLRVEV